MKREPKFTNGELVGTVKQVGDPTKVCVLLSSGERVYVDALDFKATWRPVQKVVLS